LVEEEISRISNEVKRAHGVSFENKYSGEDEVIFSAAISSKCNHLRSAPFHEGQYRSF
jgi:hypothetical protein